MKKRKIVVTTGTRAEYGILRPILKLIQKSKKLELYLVVTGSHLSKKHGETVKQIEKDGFKISTKINIVPKKDNGFNTSLSIGRGIIMYAKCFNRFKPDLNIILGDRYEMLSSAIAAYHQNIVNIHIHGGDKSGGIDEYTRHAITKISNIHFAATKKSADRIIKMGENPKHVFQVGSLSIDEILKNNISTLADINLKYNIRLTGDEIIILQHSDTTEPENSKKQIIATLRAVLKTKRDIVIIGPNIDTGSSGIINTIKYFSQKYDSIKFFDSVPREDYLGLLKNCSVLVGNSSSGIIEATLFKIPIINIGNRQKGRERGSNVIDVPEFSEKLIFSALKKALLMKKSDLKIEAIYGKGGVANKIVRYLEKANLEKDLIKKEINY